MIQKAFSSSHINYRDKLKWRFFGDVNIGVDGNHAIFKFAFTLNVFSLGTKSAIILIFYRIMRILLLAFNPCFFYKKKIEMRCFKRRRH